MGDVLIVSLTLDAFVNKPGRPIQSWEERAYMLLALRCVNDVCPTSNAMSAIRAVNPNIFVKGNDYANGDGLSEQIAIACEDIGAVIRFTTAPKESTTKLIERIKCA